MPIASKAVGQLIKKVSSMALGPQKNQRAGVGVKQEQEVLEHRG